MPQSGLCPPDFKSPSEQAQHMPPAPSNPKKRRKTSNAIAAQPPPTPLDLLPPPLSGYGDTIVASNPFDDTPSAPSMNHPMSHMVMHGMNHMHNHMNGPPMRPMHAMNMGMGPIGPMSHMTNRGGLSPMANSNMGGISPLGGMNPNIGQNISPLGPMGGMSPMSNQNSHIPNNPMGSPMSSGGPIGSPMMGSPMGSAMGSPLGGPPHLNNGPMGPPMHSPIGNSPSHMQGSRLNGNLNANGAPINHQMSQHVGGPNQNSISMASGNLCQNTGPITSNSNMSGVMNQMNHSNMMSQNNIQPNCNTNSNPMNANLMNMNMGPNHMNAMSGNGPPQSNGPPGMFGPKPMPISAGKIYPAGTPMIFNPQNPSAPPIYTCGLCHKEVNDNDEALFCESGCNFFFHR